MLNLFVGSPTPYGAASVIDDLVECASTSTQLCAASGFPTPGNARVRHIILQNRGTEVVYVRLGAAAANDGSNGELVLKACTAANDGNGGTLTLDGFQGAVYGATPTGTSNVAVNKIMG